jgi:SAM-dependent methyltransferase
MDLREQTSNPHRHPWELSRADMMLGMLAANPNDTTYADIGSGDLYFAQRLAETTRAPVFAVDVGYATPRVDGQLVVCTDLSQVPAHSVDCAVLMDVLEHVDDDLHLLGGLCRVLKPTARVLITVPAHESLWSEHDVFLGHRRRYDRQQLLGVIRRAGLTVDESFYFYCLPYLARAADVTIARLRRPRQSQSDLSLWPYPQEHWLTRFVRGTLNRDFQLSRLLKTLRWSTCGLSLCAICQRQSA